MKKLTIEQIKADLALISSSKVAIYTDKQLAHYETYKGRKFSAEHREKLRQANLGRIMSNETKAKITAKRKGTKMNISEENKRKRTDKTSCPVNQYNLEGCLITTYESQSEACRQNNILSNAGLAKALDQGQKSHGYYWRRAPHKPNIKDEIDALIGNKMKGQTRARAVLQLDLNDNVIAKWPNARVAGKALGIDNAGINNCCNKRKKGIIRSCKGFRWIFA